MGSTRIGIGVIIRDSRRLMVKAMSKCLQDNFPIKVAKALACWEGLLLAQQLGLQKVITKMDCLVLTHKL